MSKPGSDVQRDKLKHWMSKLLPIGTQVIDGEGEHYAVNGWYIVNNQIRVKLIRTAGRRMSGRDVLFDEVMRWSRFPPDHEENDDDDHQHRPLVGSYAEQVRV